MVLLSFLPIYLLDLIILIVPGLVRGHDLLVILAIDEEVLRTELLELRLTRTVMDRVHLLILKQLLLLVAAVVQVRKVIARHVLLLEKLLCCLRRRRRVVHPARIWLLRREGLRAATICGP